MKTPARRLRDLGPMPKPRAVIVSVRLSTDEASRVVRFGEQAGLKLSDTLRHLVVSGLGGWQTTTTQNTANSRQSESVPE